MQTRWIEKVVVTRHRGRGEWLRVVHFRSNLSAGEHNLVLRSNCVQ